MKEQILKLAAAQGDSAVRAFISKSIRDLKTAQYTRSETKETMLELTPDHYHEFVNSECASIY